MAAETDSPPSSPTGDDPLNLLEDLIGRARAAGAEAADALYALGESLSHEMRLGEVENLERAEGHDLGLRVLIGRRQAIVSTTDMSAAALDELVERAVAMARVVPEDPFCGLADADQLVADPPAFEMAEDAEPTAEALIERAKACEDAARAVEGITNSEGAEAGWGRTGVWLAASNGFTGAYQRSSHSVAVSVVAGEGAGMERDYEWRRTAFLEDLPDPADIGRKAGQRTVARLNARKMPSAQVPVVYDPRVAGRLIGHLLGAINGSAVARGTSFLKDSLGAQVFAEGVSIVEDPHRPRGHSSKPFDAEGLPNRQRRLIDNGVLTTWLLDLRTARQLEMTPTGHASRGPSGPPSPSSTNVYIEAGGQTPADLMADIASGFYITELMGMGVNGVTGDYSMGAGGFWIEDGEIAFPVTELTVAGNLRDMYRELTPANDLAFDYGTDSPTVRIEGMTVAGN